MNKRIAILLIVLLSVAAVSIFCPVARSFASPSDNPDDFLILTDLRIKNSPDSARIVIHTNRYFEYVDYELQDSSGGIVFDPSEPLYINIKDTVFDKSGLINDVKLVKSSLQPEELPAILKEGFYPLDYLVIRLNQNARYEISQRANLLIIDIGEKQPPLPDEFVSSFTMKNPQPANPLTREPLAPQDVASDFIKTKREPQPEVQQVSTFKDLRDQILARSLASKIPSVKLPEGKNSFNFKDCLEIGTANFMPLVIAEEDMKLSGMKINEAKRGLYPTATAKFTDTTGRTLGLNFVERTYGMQVDQPLYYGGRLKLTVKEAEVNREVAQAKFDKAEADVVSKITETFYALATAQLNLDDQKELYAKSKEMLALAEKKYEKELTTKLELMNVQSQCDQIEYQMSVASKDLDIAKVNLLQAMGADPQSQIKADMSLDYNEHIIDLNKCFVLAYQNRPELRMNELLEEAAGYEEKIAKSKDDFKVDFSGFLGESGSWYTTENPTMGSDWFVGFKASKPWLGNTGSYNYTQNKTSPKLGQDTVTQGASNSLEFAILNNLSGNSEKQSAFISKLKAENELIEIEKTISTEVREAHNSYEKAVMQIQNTKEKIAFRKEELKILQSQMDINEAQLSQVLEAMIKLNDEKALYHQAISSYKTALANLNKATGLIGNFE